MYSSYLHDIQVFLPEKRLDNGVLSKRYKVSEKEIFESTGVRNRHVAAKDQTGSDLALKAGKKLFENCPNALESIDFLLYCSHSMDYKGPATACLLQDRLGLRTDIGAMDIPMGCAGFTNGLSMATALIQSGRSKNVLLLNADIPSTCIHPDDKELVFLFGDGATAALISSTSGELSAEVGGFIHHTNGRGSGMLYVESSAVINPVDEDWLTSYRDVGGMKLGRLRMDGIGIFSFALKEVPRLVQEILKTNELEMHEIDHFVFHQANGYLLEVLRKKLNIEKDRFVLSLTNYGNTVSASVPIALSDMKKEGRIKKGEKVLIAGFGIGLSWSGTVLKF